MTPYPGPVSTHMLGLTSRHSLLLGQCPEQGIVVRNLRKKT